MCQVCVVVLLSMSCLESAFHEDFIKPIREMLFFKISSTRLQISAFSHQQHKSPPRTNVHTCKKIPNQTQQKGSQHIKCQFIQSTKTYWPPPPNLPTVAVQQHFI